VYNEFAVTLDAKAADWDAKLSPNSVSGNFVSADGYTVVITDGQVTQLVPP
jgi:hypothetical protein